MESISLRKGAVWSGVVRKGCRIVPEAGALWLTMEHDPCDVLLQPAASYQAQNRGLLVIQALTDGKFHVDNSCAEVERLGNEAAIANDKMRNPGSPGLEDQLAS